MKENSIEKTERWEDLAFNQGSDARLAGKPLYTTPFDFENPCYDWWEMGWKEVDKYWGIESLGPVSKLPEVKHKKSPRHRGPGGTARTTL